MNASKRVEDYAAWHVGVRYYLMLVFECLSFECLPQHLFELPDLLVAWA
jgi:hypothetical protein